MRNIPEIYVIGWKVHTLLKFVIGFNAVHNEIAPSPHRHTLQTESMSKKGYQGETHGIIVIKIVYNYNVLNDTRSTQGIHISLNTIKCIQLLFHTHVKHSPTDADQIVQIRPGSGLDGLNRFWPNSSGPEGSRCARIIWPGSDRPQPARYKFPTFRLGCFLPQTARIILCKARLDPIWFWLTCGSKPVC